MIDQSSRRGDVDAIDRAEAHSRVGRNKDAVELLKSVDGSSLAVTDRFRLVEARLAHGLVNAAIDELEVLLASLDAEHSLRAAYTLGEVYSAHQMPADARAMYRRTLEADDPYWSPIAASGLAAVEDLDPVPAPLVVHDELSGAADPALLEPAIDLRNGHVVVSRDSRNGIEHALMPTSRNPYAALAPDDLEDAPNPTARNPYAELAPNYKLGQPDPIALADPAHWRSILEDWPAETRQGFFARYV